MMLGIKIACCVVLLFLQVKLIQPCVTTYSNPTVLGNVQLNTISTQMSAYVHKSLLAGYSWFRADWYTVVAYVTIALEGMTKIRYSKFHDNETSIYATFSDEEHKWAAMMTCESHMPSMYPRPKPYPLLLYDAVSNNPATNNTDSYDLALPLFLYEVAVVFTVPGLKSLQLSRDSMRKLFTGVYKMWSDLPATAYPGQTITDPTQPITMYILSQANQFNKIICQYVKNAGADWTQADMDAFCLTGDMFPASATNPTFKRVRSPDGALASLTNTPYSMMYTSRVNLMAYGKAVTTATIQNAAGNYISANFTTLNTTIYGNNLTLAANGFGLVDLPHDTAYPLIGMSFICVRSSPDIRNGPHVDILVSSEVLRYYRWINRDPGALKRLLTFEALPIPNATYDAMISLIKTEWWASLPRDEDNSTFSVWAEMEYQSSQERLTDFKHVFLVYVLPPLVAFIIVSYLTWRLILWFILYRKVHYGVYQIPAEDIVFIETSKERYRCMLHGRAYLDSRPENDIPFLTGEYKSGVVLLRSFPMAFNTSSLKVRQELVHMQEWRCHKNLVKFLGVAEVRRQRYIVSELSLLGDLRTLLNSVSQQHLLTQPVRFNMARGVAEGMRYLHEQMIVHGNLRSSSVYVESDWSVKISDWEYAHLYTLQGMFVAKEQTFKKVHRIPKMQQIPLTVPHLWTAPELIKAAVDQTGLLPQRTADIYSYGIIFYEILTSFYPYKWNPSSGPPLPIIMRILNPKKPLRPLDLETPETLAEIPDSMLRLMRSCWQVDPERRVTSYGISVILAEVQAETKRMADLTIINTDFFIEKQKAEIKNYNSDLRQRVLDLKRAGEEFQTPVVYERTRSKLPTEPALIEKAYIMHITMVEYSELLGETHGESAIALIERFQTMINQHLQTIQDPNIFRLHASGDDCTILCGIPEGGLQYADVVATMAFDILTITWKAVMLDIDIDHIKIRIGIHCGPVLAGLYGGEHSEYTIIGDNRDIAEDMERLSATFRILISEDFLEDLKHFNGYSYILNTDRSRFHEKKTTYWLLGRENYPFQESLDEIHGEFGHITDGRLPVAPKKKAKSAIAGAAPSHLERVQARRTSIAMYDAQKINENRPSILERRKPRDSRISRGSLGPDAVRKSVKSYSIVEPENGDTAKIDVVKLGNVELIVVDFDDDDEHALAMADAQRRFLYPGPPTSGLSVIKEASSMGFESLQEINNAQPGEQESVQQSDRSSNITDQPSYQSSTLTDAEEILHSISEGTSSVLDKSFDNFSGLESFVTNSIVTQPPPRKSMKVSVGQKAKGAVRMTVSETVRAQPGIVAHPNPFTLAVQAVNSDTASQPFTMTVSETVATQPTVVSHPNPFILAGLMSGRRSAKVAPAPQSTVVEIQRKSPADDSGVEERVKGVKSVPSIQLTNIPISQTELPTEPSNSPLQQSQSTAPSQKAPSVKDRLSMLEKQSQQSERSERSSITPSWSIRSQAGSSRVLGDSISGVSSVQTWSTIPHDVPSQYTHEFEAPSATSSTPMTPTRKDFPSTNASSLTTTGEPSRFPPSSPTKPSQPLSNFSSLRLVDETSDSIVPGVNSVKTWAMLPEIPSSNPATVGSFFSQAGAGTVLKESSKVPARSPTSLKVPPKIEPELVNSTNTSSDMNVRAVTSVKTWASLPEGPSMTNPALTMPSSVVVRSLSKPGVTETLSEVIVPGVTSVKTWTDLPEGTRRQSEQAEDSKDRVKNQWRSLLDKQVTRRRSSLPAVAPLMTEGFILSEPAQENKAERVINTWRSLVQQVQHQRRQSENIQKILSENSPLGMIAENSSREISMQDTELVGQSVVENKDKKDSPLPTTIVQGGMNQPDFSNIDNVVKKSVVESETQLQGTRRQSEQFEDSKDRVKNQWRSLLDKQVTRRRSSLPAAVSPMTEGFVLFEPTEENKAERVINTWRSLVEQVQNQRRQSFSLAIPFSTDPSIPNPFSVVLTPPVSKVLQNASKPDNSETASGIIASEVVPVQTRASLPGVFSTVAETLRLLQSQISTNQPIGVTSVKTWSTLPEPSLANEQHDEISNVTTERSSLGTVGPEISTQKDAQSMSLQKQTTIFDVSKPKEITLRGSKERNGEDVPGDGIYTEGLVEDVPSQATLENTQRIPPENSPLKTIVENSSREISMQDTELVGQSVVENKDKKDSPLPTTIVQGGMNQPDFSNIDNVVKKSVVESETQLQGTRRQSEQFEDSKDRVKNQWRSLLDKQVTRRRSSLPAAVSPMTEGFVLFEPTEENKAERVINTWRSLVEQVQHQRRQSLSPAIPFSTVQNTPDDQPDPEATTVSQGPEMRRYSESANRNSSAQPSNTTFPILPLPPTRTDDQSQKDLPLPSTASSRQSLTGEKVLSTARERTDIPSSPSVDSRSATKITSREKVQSAVAEVLQIRPVLQPEATVLFTEDGQVVVLPPPANFGRTSDNIPESLKAETSEGISLPITAQQDTSNPQTTERESQEPFTSAQTDQISATDSRPSEALQMTSSVKHETLPNTEEPINDVSRLSLADRTIPSISLPKDSMKKNVEEGRVKLNADDTFQSSTTARLSLAGRKLSEAPTANRVLSPRPTVVRQITPEADSPAGTDEATPPVSSTTNRLSLSSRRKSSLTDDPPETKEKRPSVAAASRNNTEDAMVSSKVAMRLSLTGKKTTDATADEKPDSVAKVVMEEPLLSTVNRLSLTPRVQSTEAVLIPVVTPAVVVEERQEESEAGKSRRASKRSSVERRVIEIVQRPITMTPSEVEEILKKRRRSSKSRTRRKSSTRQSTTATQAFPILPLRTINQTQETSEIDERRGINQPQLISELAVLPQSNNQTEELTADATSINQAQNTINEFGPSVTVNRLSLSTRQPSDTIQEQALVVPMTVEKKSRKSESRRKSKKEKDTVVKDESPVVIVPILEVTPPPKEDEAPHAQKERKRKKKLQPHHSIHSHRSIENPMDHLPAGQLSPMERVEKARRESREADRVRRESASRVVPWLNDVEAGEIAVGEGPVIVGESPSAPRTSPDNSVRMADLVLEPLESLSWLTDADNITQTGLPKKPRGSR